MYFFRAIIFLGSSSEALNSVGPMRCCNFFLNASGPRLSYPIVARHPNLHSAFLARYIVALLLSYYRSNSFKANDIWELNYVTSSWLWFSPRYNSFTWKMMGLSICPKFFSSKMYIRLWKSNNTNGSEVSVLRFEVWVEVIFGILLLLL